MLTAICIAILPFFVGGMKYYLSSETHNWKNLKNNCQPVDASLICPNKMCNAKHIPELDDSNLPESFSAWINAYLIKSASIVYKGCFQASKAAMDLVSHNSKRKRGCTNIIECANLCLKSPVEHYSYLGIHDSTCYCLSETAFVYPNVTDKSGETDENTCLKGEENLQSYEILKHIHLEKDRCPVAYPISHVVVYLDNCLSNKKTKLFCVGMQSSGVESNSWYKAREYCKNHSTTLVNRFQYIPDSLMKYWTHGLQYNEYELRKPLPLFDTRCAVLRRSNSKYSVEAVNCSFLLPTLCQKVEPFDPPGGVTARPSPTFDKTTLSAKDDDVTSELQIETVQKETDILTTPMILKTKTTTPTTSTKTILIEDSTTNPTPKTTLAVWHIIIIVVGIVVLIVVSMVSFFIHKRSANTSPSRPNDQREQMPLQDSS